MEVRNPILQDLDTKPTDDRFSGIRSFIQTVKNAGNPQAMVMGMLNRNPQVQEVLNNTVRSGGTYEDAFRAMAKARGINPDDIIKLLR